MPSPFPHPGQTIAWVPGAAVACDVTWRVTHANDQAVLLLDRDPVGALVTDVLPGDVGEAAWRTQVIRADDVPRLVHVRCSEPGPEGVRLLLLDEPVPAAVLSETQRALDLAFELAPIGMALFDVDGRYVRVNDSLCALLGRPAEELIGLRDQALTHPDDRDGDLDAASRILRGELDHWQTEKRFLLPDGGEVWTIANLTFLRTREGLPLVWLGQFQDITERKLLEGDLRREADEDPLTGLANRRRLATELTRELSRARRTGSSGAVLVLDLDGFKQVNDVHGHAAGDEVLRRVGRALRRRLRAEDLVARLGGDEFAVLLPVADAAQAEVVAEELERAVAAVALPDGERGRLGASVGVAAFGPASAPLDPDELLDAADGAMYRAKAHRRPTTA